MLLRKVGTLAIGLALAISVPLSDAAAATRPSSAVPTAASVVHANSGAQSVSRRSVQPWPAYAVIALTIALSVWIAAQHSNKHVLGLPISRG